MAHRGSRCIALFLDCGTRRGWRVSVTPWPLFTPRKDPVPIVQEAGWAPGPVCTGVENLTPHRIQTLVCPACSNSLCRLHCPGPWCFVGVGGKNMSWLLYLWEREPVTIVQVVGWAPEPVWKCAEEQISCHINFETPKRPAHCSSLYWLCCPNPTFNSVIVKNWNVVWSGSTLLHVILSKSLSCMLC